MTLLIILAVSILSPIVCCLVLVTLSAALEIDPSDYRR